MVGGETEQKCDENKNDYSFFFRRKNQSMLESIPPREETDFQFLDGFLARGRTRKQRNFPLMLAL
jgi:hypothetical protein